MSTTRSWLGGIELREEKGAKAPGDHRVSKMDLQCHLPTSGSSGSVARLAPLIPKSRHTSKHIQLQFAAAAADVVLPAACFTRARLFPACAVSNSWHKNRGMGASSEQQHRLVAYFLSMNTPIPQAWLQIRNCNERCLVF